MDYQKQGSPYYPPGYVPPHPQGVYPSAPPAPGSEEHCYGYPPVPPQPPYQQGYQGYFYQGYPPPPPPPPPPHQCIPPPHCHHYESHGRTYSTSFLEGCLYALCCCCLLEECCF